MFKDNLNVRIVNLIKSVFYVGIAFILLLAAYSLRNLAGQDIIAGTALEGVTIIGWVFLWEAISTFAFKNREVKSKNKHYKRFIHGRTDML